MSEHFAAMQHHRINTRSCTGSASQQPYSLAQKEERPLNDVSAASARFATWLCRLLPGLVNAVSLHCQDMCSKLCVTKQSHAHVPPFYTSFSAAVITMQGNCVHGAESRVLGCTALQCCDMFGEVNPKPKPRLHPAVECCKQSGDEPACSPHR